MLNIETYEGSFTRVIFHVLLLHTVTHCQNFWSRSAFLKNIKYHQEVWKNLSVEILWKFLTAGHLIHLRPCPAVGQLDNQPNAIKYSCFHG